jgi:predicted nucleic acid-binding protein
VIILDTSVLSAAYRRRRSLHPEPPCAAVLRRLILADAPLAVPGIVLQELLTGLKSDAEFIRVRKILDGFPTLVATPAHHVEAARIANRCYRAGASCSQIDCLIAALAISSGSPLLTTDQDFVRMAPHCGLKLYPVT